MGLREVKLPGLTKYGMREDGEVISYAKGPARPLVGGVDKDGYRRFVLIDDTGKRRYFRRCVLICSAYNGERPDGMNVRHLDGSRANDEQKNLEWATQAVNCADKVVHGTALRGERSLLSKISEATASKIIELLPMPTREIGLITGASKCTINSIRYGKSWAWLKGNI